MFLALDKFRDVVLSTPLISIDFLVKNSQQQYLLGQRINRPAKGYWFVPGGRIRKDESITQAQIRLLSEELGIVSVIKCIEPLGIYEHFYKDSFVCESESTHYVVLCYQLISDIDISTLPNNQHNSYQWFSEEELLNSDIVHQYTKDYLLK
jgi:colanic acid biosynthesis protein WcaH